MRPSRSEGRDAGAGTLRRGAETPGPIALSGVAPGGLPRLPEVQGTPGGHRRGDVPEVYRSRLDPNRRPWPERRRQPGQRAGRRAGPRLAGSTPGRRRPLGRRRPPRTTTAAFRGDDDFTVHCPARRDLLRRVLLLGGRHGRHRPVPAGVPGGRLHPHRRQIRRARWTRASNSCSGAEARRRPAGRQQGRRHVLPLDGRPRPLRGLCADRRRPASRPGRAGRRLPGPIAGPRRHGLALRARGRWATRASWAGWSWS